MTPPCCVSLSGSVSSSVCLTKALFCGFATGWTNTSRPMPATRAMTNVLPPTPVCAGRWPCDRAKVGRSFGVFNCQFGDVKVRYRGLKKNTLQFKGAVCAAKPLDGPASINGGPGLSASESRQTALNRIKMSKCHLKNGAEKPDQKASCLI